MRNLGRAIPGEFGHVAVAEVDPVDLEVVSVVGRIDDMRVNSTGRPGRVGVESIVVGDLDGRVEGSSFHTAFDYLDLVVAI